jgi:hypothetical protein
MGCTLASGKRRSKMSTKGENLSQFAKGPLMPLPTKSDKVPAQCHQVDDHLVGQVSIKPLLIDHSNSIQKKAQCHTNNFVSTKGNLSDDSHLNHQVLLLESRLYATPMDSLLNENNTLICNDFDSLINLSVHEESLPDYRNSVISRQQSSGLRFLNNYSEISQIQNAESLFEERKTKQGMPAKENFQLDLSDFPEYKFFDEGFEDPAKPL